MRQITVLGTSERSFAPYALVAHASRHAASTVVSTFRSEPQHGNDFSATPVDLVTVTFSASPNAMARGTSRRYELPPFVQCAARIVLVLSPDCQSILIWCAAALIANVEKSLPKTANITLQDILFLTDAARRGFRVYLQVYFERFPVHFANRKLQRRSIKRVRYTPRL
jgi:hypothetical protein